jgi:uncharacterized NAD(P)/FAD-binding protein YdhS
MGPFPGSHTELPTGGDLVSTPVNTPTVVVIGGGFSGSMTAAQLLRRASESAIRVVLVERQAAVGEGMAYSTRDPMHLLNVPAGKMSAWPDRPHDFVEWAKERYGNAEPTDFLPRQWYGEYVRESLMDIARESGDPARLSLVCDEARRIARRMDGGWIIYCERGAPIAADALVLATGHRPPGDPVGPRWSGPRDRYIADPWAPSATARIRPDEPVTILGTGLTAVDAVMSLSHHPRQAPITLISRRGLLPQAHSARPSPPADFQSLVEGWLAMPGGVTVKALLRGLREKAADRAAAGEDWRGVIDGLRPHTAALWRAMPLSERRKFLARLRPFWDVHRHRMAVKVADRFAALSGQGLVRTVAGQVTSATADESGARLSVRERSAGMVREIRAAWVLNCTGPTASNSAESSPAIGSLLEHGWVQPDELALGLETTEGNALCACGEAAPDLFVIGTLRRPGLWESTAVPELRGQAEAVADCVLTYLNQLCADHAAFIECLFLAAVQDPCGGRGEARRAARLVVECRRVVGINRVDRWLDRFLGLATRDATRQPRRASAGSRRIARDG